MSHFTFSGVFISFLLSLTHVMVEKVLFLGQIFGMEIFMHLHFLTYPESEIHIFSDWLVCLYVYQCVCLSACYQHNLKRNYRKNLMFGILHLHHIQMLLETFYRNWTKASVQGHAKDF